MTATVVGAINQHVPNAHLAHLAEGDLDRPAVGVRWRVASDRERHAGIEARRRRESNYQCLGARLAQGYHAEKPDVAAAARLGVMCAKQPQSEVYIS